jgi:BirA family biotin operon repressor/biotin-[acetyl-CoA-carboxylase] ligase
LSALPLAIGVAVCRALSRCGVHTHGLKWPNDVLADGAKLAGILVETEASGHSLCAVIGVGVNVNMPEDSAGAINQPWTDITSQLPPTAGETSRNAVAGVLLDEMLHCVEIFGRRGFAPFASEWQRLDLLTGRVVVVDQNGHTITGLARGVSLDGALRVEIEDNEEKPMVREFRAGDVSVRDA